MSDLQKGDSVWYMDMAHIVLEVRRIKAHIQEIGENHLPGVDDYWVDIDDLELFNDEDYGIDEDGWLDD